MKNKCNPKVSSLSSIFGSSNDNPPPPPSGKGEWTISAGRKGNKLKRPSVPVNYLGTNAKFKPDPFLEQKENDRMEREFNKYTQENNDLFKEALDILSQSETGRDLLDGMTKSGYRIVFDDRRTGSRGAGGLCDPDNKLIVLRSSRDADYIALVLGHEAAHAMQHSRHNLFPSSLHKPEVGIRLSFAIEADAYAQQVQIALELKHGDPKGPENQIRYDKPLRQMRKRFPNIVNVAEKAMAKKDALENGAVVAAAFEAFYDNPQLRTFYEDAHTEWCSLYAPQLFKGLSGVQKHFSKDINSDSIASKLLHKGKPYLKEHTPSINFLDKRHSGLTNETREKIFSFYDSFKPKEKKPRLYKFGIHMDNAVAWIFGRFSESSAIVVKDKKKVPPVKPPLNIIPKKNIGF